MYYRYCYIALSKFTQLKRLCMENVDTEFKRCVSQFMETSTITKGVVTTEDCVLIDFKLAEKLFEDKLAQKIRLHVRKVIEIQLAPIDQFFANDIL